MTTFYIILYITFSIIIGIIMGIMGKKESFISWFMIGMLFSPIFLCLFIGAALAYLDEKMKK